MRTWAIILGKGLRTVSRAVMMLLTSLPGKRPKSATRPQQHLKKPKNIIKSNMTKKHRATPDFKIDNKVLVEATNIEQNRPSPKFSDNCVGPHKIVEKIPASSYNLRLPETAWIHDVFNKVLLTPYQETPPHRWRNVRTRYRWQFTTNTRLKESSTIEKRDAVISS